MSANTEAIETADELGAIVGERLATASANLREEAADLMHRLADLQAAWAERDWLWLADAGFLSKRLAAELVQAELEASL
jgi:hypothetical protein